MSSLRDEPGMKRLRYREIIHDAWVFTSEHKRLMLWYSFLPAIFTTIVGIGYVAYQFFAFKNSELFGDAAKSFLGSVVRFGFDFFDHYPDLLLPAIITAAVAAVVYFLLPTLCQGGLIRVVAKKRLGENVRALDGVAFGMLAFLPLFEYHLIVKTFSLFGVFTEGSFIARNLGEEAVKLLLPLLVLVAIVGFVLSLLFTYTEFFIVLEKQKVLSSMGQSAKLVTLNWQHTFLIGILMLLIGARVIVNIVAVLLVPALIVFSAGFLATITLKTIGLIFGLLIGIVALLLAAYFNGILNMFANTVWTFTFLELRK